MRILLCLVGATALAVAGCNQILDPSITEDMGGDTDADGDADLPEGTLPCDTVFHVDPGSTSFGDGTTWALAFSDLQAGIDAAAGLHAKCAEPIQVWAMGGDYRVWSGSPQDTVKLRAGAHLYGGFSGSEMSTWERDTAANQSILNGAGGPDDSDHVLHVVTGAPDSVLDGFVVVGGDASAPDSKRR